MTKYNECSIHPMSSSTCAVVRLPMEVWAHVAHFLPFNELISTFWALRRANLLPYTNTPASNALLQFCSEVSEPIDAPVRTITLTLRNGLVELGFSDSEIDHAISICNANDQAMIEFLFARYG